MKRFVVKGFAILAFGFVLAGPAVAQLPKIPGADRAPGTKASVPGEGGGALEPYLVTLLLPIGGIVMAIAGIAMDQRIRSAGGG